MTTAAAPQAILTIEPVIRNEPDETPRIRSERTSDSSISALATGALTPETRTAAMFNRTTSGKSSTATEKTLDHRSFTAP